MQSNVLNDLAKAKRRRTEKKKTGLCQSTAPATHLSFWNIGRAALRDLLNTPRSPAAMLRQCEVDWSCHMLLYSVPQQHCRGGCGGSALPAQKLSGEKMQDHMEVRPWRRHGMRDGTHRGTKICVCFEVKVPHGACVFILDCRLSWKQWISWLVIIASVFWFQLIQSWRILYRFESPCGCSCWALPRSLFALFLCWMAKRISGWGICVSPFAVRGCSCLFMLWFAYLHDHRCPCRSYFNLLLLM